MAGGGIVDQPAEPGDSRLDGFFDGKTPGVERDRFQASLSNLFTDGGGLFRRRVHGDDDTPFGGHQARILVAGFGEVTREVDKAFETLQKNARIKGFRPGKVPLSILEQRFKSGAINFQTVEVKFNLDDEGRPLSVYIKEQKESNHLIEDLMLLANRRVAEFIGKTKGRQVKHDENNSYIRKNNRGCHCGLLAFLYWESGIS